MKSRETACPQCGSMRVKPWDELSRDEQIAAERLPSSTQFSAKERKKHRFCTRCWYEQAEKERRA